MRPVCGRTFGASACGRWGRMVARKVEVMAVLDCRAKENGAVICVVIGSVILISDGEGDTFGEMWASRRAGGEGDGKRGGGG